MKLLFFISLIALSMLSISFKKEIEASEWEPASKTEFISASEKAMAWFSKTLNYKVDIKYASYTDHNSLNAHDVFIGFYKRYNTNFHTSSMGINVIQNDKVRLSIDTLNHLIILQNKTEDSQTPPVDSKSISDLLDHVKSIKKQKDEHGAISYRLDFKPNELYMAYEFKVNEKGLLSELKYYYSKELKTDTKDGNTLKGKPRLEVLLSNYKSNVDFNYDSEFSEIPYLKVDGKKIILSEKYKKFQFKDYRFQVKK